jgi:hypothetical protein
MSQAKKIDAPIIAERGQGALGATAILNTLPG